MKNKRDISDLIRDNQHKLEERPSSRAWDRLQSKLDYHENKGRTFLYRRLAIAAAVVALVAVVSLLAVMNQNASDSTMAKTEITTSYDETAQNLEAINVDDSQNVQRVIEFQRVLKERYANPISEGNETKKLLASNKQLTSTSASNSGSDLLAMNETKPAKTYKDTITSTSNLVIKREFKTKIDALSDATESKNISKLSIQNYKWMAGTWNENNTKLEIQFLNQAELISDDFQIKQLGNELFFTRKKPTSSTYVFIEKNNTLTIFENQKKEKVILERIDKTSFSLTYLSQNGKEDLIKTYTIDGGR